MKPVYLRFSGSIVLLALAVLFTSLPATGLESGLLGVPIGATPQELMHIYGPAMGVVTAGKDGRLSLNTLRTTEEEIRARLGLIGELGSTAPPGWARPVLPGKLASDQQMWIYRIKGNLTAGFILKGTGEDAIVTDIIAFSIKPNVSVKTERGISIGDSFSQLVMSYGYPPVLQPFGGGTRQAERGAATPSGRALSGGGSPGFGGAGGALRRPTRRGGQGGGGRMGGRPGGRAGGQGAGRTGRGQSRGSSGGGAQGSSGTQVSVLDRPISFSRNCIIIYDGIVFTLHEFRVVRIHVTE